MVTIYLFDIDCTLVDIMDLHVIAYQKAYKAVFNIYVPREVMERGFGKAQILFLRGICEELNIDYKKHQLEKVKEAWKTELLKNIKPSDVKILPGVKQFLEILKNKKLPCGIITGNPEIVGKALLRKTGLIKYFQIQSYGDNANNRAEIVENAVKQAREKGYKIRKVIVIGDSPYDIEAGRAVGAFKVGVASGYHTKNKLKKAGADLVLGSLKEYEKIFNVLKQ